MAQRAKITVSRSASGVVIQVSGAGTLSESPVVHAFADQVLGDRGQRVTIHLASCTYMDSTFLGGLVSLFRRHGASGRFAIFAPEPERRSLFGVSRLDTILPFVDDAPAASADVQPLEINPPASSEDMARYVADCHRLLAELGGAEAQEFARVADALAADLERNRRP